MQGQEQVRAQAQLQGVVVVGFLVQVRLVLVGVEGEVWVLAQPRGEEVQGQFS